ncbi:DJ-1/PfpI family protein [Bacillus sp. NEB1478]|uniref:DJ-1/PfpI family protein n=1 Tax=Bacillus sp. NEB1478 TaxID=3073816 RepID=UPI002872E52F|nr:DJ-1/PfpI family protein [Bacillus sp. NEB1478]WNB91681.1 DJ-1/PfpI family protein [Bacillus sp. NEB1478]
MKKVLMFVYDSFAEFEVSILITCLSGKKTNIDLFTCSDKAAGETVTSTGRMKVMPDLTLDEVNPEDYCALIIPGGSPFTLFENKKVISMVRSFFDQNILIGAICGGPGLLGAAGIFEHVQYTASLTKDDMEYLHVLNWENKRDELLVVDQNVVTATGSNYIQFAEEILRQLNIVPKTEEYPLQYFREPSLA